MKPTTTVDLRLSVIVPARNAHLHLSRCLDALSRSDYLNCEVIVVDDCSTDITPQIAARYGARCLHTPQTLGPAGARNLGARSAAGEILVFVDADVVVPPDALSRIADDFARDPELAAVFGSYDDQPAWTTFISQYKNLMHHYVHQMASESATTFWAGCGAMRKSVFEEFHGFDAETYTTPSIEDIALGLELVQQGRTIRLDKKIEVKHLKRWTARNLLRADILYRAIPWTRLILTSRQLPRDLNLTYASRASSLLVGLLSVGLVLLPFSISGLLPRRPAPLLAAIALIAVALVLLNLDVYRFFLRKRGWWFAARAVVAHWVYYLYSGITFFACLAAHVLTLPLSPPRKASVRRT
ncbi:MAG: glycosyltransferase family A protein [Candidatus Korobacteraceae bacterium]